jgi:hypothetical protein
MIPVLYVVFQWIREFGKRTKKAPSTGGANPPATAATGA